MKKLLALVLVALIALAAPAAAAPAAPTAPSAADRLAAYRAELDRGQVEQLRREGRDVVTYRAPDGTLLAELILTARDAQELRDRGLRLEQRGSAEAQADLRALQPDPERTFRSYSEPGGLRDEMVALADARPDLVKLVEIGTTVQGQPIYALKVTKGANEVEDGSKPASLYTSLQHAREWITGEINRRLLHLMVDSYGSDEEITRLLDDNEYWFVLVLNPDGYDYTFSTDRLWRKNLADNDGDRQITLTDGVDLNRNFPYRWGYDNEGSSPDPSNQTYRGPAPGSEPETQALINLFETVDFSFLINYHSAAELLLYGVGWQVATPSPDDVIYEALAGTDQTGSAVPGYDPDISAELYTTNGETTSHGHAVNGVLGFTPEATTCQTASAWDPDDEWVADDCESVFNFPDDEALIQREFDQNVAFALDVARSTADPDDPVSHLANEAPPFRVNTFDVSYGDRQVVEAWAKRQDGPVVVEYRINNGRAQFALAPEWNGGERYGGENDVYYRPVRGTIRGTEPGDTVEVRFRSLEQRSEPFTYTVQQDSGHQVLVLANEDYDGFNPVQDADAPKYLDAYTAALDANGISYDVWDQDAQGAPHPLGVLSHYDALVWYTGDNRITQDEEDSNVFGQPNLGVADVQQATVLSVRDFLNEGGKLFHTGENAGYFGDFGVLFFADDDDLTQQCGPESDNCALLSDDFYQYYLGAYARFPFDATDQVAGVAEPLTDDTITVAGEGTNEQDETGQFVVTSDVLPPEEFPQFTSFKSAEYVDPRPDPTQPQNGDWYVGTLHADEAYMRLSRTVDLTAASAATLSYGLSYTTEPSYDSVIFEVRPAGTDDWTTLPDEEGRATSSVPAECEAGFLLAMHPFLEHYLTLGEGACAPTGTTGEWHAFTGNSRWAPATFDLSAYAGQEIEVAISYVTDPASGGTGVFVDDAVLTVDGAVVEEEGFEGGLGAWSVGGPPEGSPGNVRTWERSQSLLPPLDLAAAVSTEDTVYIGFGFEAIASEAQRNEVMGEVMGYLLP